MLQNFTRIRRNEKKENVYPLKFQFIFLLRLYLLYIILKMIFFSSHSFVKIKKFFLEHSNSIPRPNIFLSWRKMTKIRNNSFVSRDARRMANRGTKSAQSCIN